MTSTKHKFYDMAYSAYRNTTFSPEKWARGECDYYDAVCREFVELGKESAIEKFTRLFTKYLSAQGRCASSMITGPANFPVDRQEKYRRWANNADAEMRAFVDKVKTPKPEPRYEKDYKIQSAEFERDSVKVVYNTELNRLQLQFDGKPEREVIEKLKRSGFKWSPRNVAWQRQLTPNALRAMTEILPGLSYREAINIACGMEVEPVAQIMTVNI